MSIPSYCVIKSFKHNGALHRMWLQNLRIPGECLQAEEAAENMIVTVNCRTRIVEADGGEWISKSPGVSFFIPGKWYNIVALLEGEGIRYYCNIASPPYVYEDVLTYIDYDLDLIVTPSGDRFLVDQDEYDRHRISYRYDSAVEAKVKEGLMDLTERQLAGRSPFSRERVMFYYDYWKKVVESREDS